MNLSMASTNRLFTLGHSNLELSDFLGTLLRHEIKVVCDVRSRPGIFVPAIQPRAAGSTVERRENTLRILWRGLGGRPVDPQFYLANGLVDYSKRRRAPAFLEAIDQTVALSRERKTAILCAEEDPLHCHRFLLIGPALLDRGAVPLHLRRGGAAETQRDAEDRLLQLHGFADVTSDSLFAQGRESALEDALRLQSEQYGFRTSPEAIEYF